MSISWTAPVKTHRPVSSSAYAHKVSSSRRPHPSSKGFHSEPRTVSTKKRIQDNTRQTAQIETLKRDLDIARSRYMSRLYLNGEMAKTIRKLGGEVPQFGGVSGINIDPDSTDIPY